MTAALDCLDQALAVDPTYAPAIAGAAHCHAQRHFQEWVPRDDAHRANGVRLARRAVEKAPNDAQVLWMAAFAVWTMAQEGREASRELFSRSLMINPNSAMALALGGWIETMCGNQRTGREMIGRARRLSPLDPRGWFMSGAMAIAAIMDENYAEAVTWAEKALVQNGRFAVALRALAVALVNIGQRDRAAQVVREMLAIEPELTISGFLAGISVPNKSLARTYAEALREAGLPE
jgi:tetratricopeptide (TPR) repeat protein